MCGGSGSSLIGKAMESGAQAYICGDISYHHFFTPKNFMVMDIGHFEGEVEIVSILFSLLRKKFPTFAVRTSSRLAASNPVYYF
jgi:putative NIF3 family GTP cyclohydrolase 1 type 2